MIIVGSLNSNKTQLLVEHYVQLIENGVLPEQVLFLTLNSYKKEKVSNIIKAFLSNHSPNIQTFLGLCYNSILNNKEVLEKEMPQSAKEEFTMCGLEVSQNLFLEAVSEVGFKDYNSKINLVHQLLRRHSLIVSNNLSSEDVKVRSKILNENFAAEANRTIDLFKLKTLERRAFDYLRQQSLFKWLYENTNAMANIKHIIIDDYDEQTPACTDFFKKIKKQLDSWVVGIDPQGTTRCGYLCADLDCVKILDAKEKIIDAQEQTYTNEFEFYKYSKRLEMLDVCVDKVIDFVQNGVSPDDISIITPTFDNQLKFTLASKLEKFNVNVQFVSGSEKLSDNNLIKSVLSLLQLINGIEKNSDSCIDAICSVFHSLLSIPIKKSCDVIKNFKYSGGFAKYDFLNEELNKRYEKFLGFVTQVSLKDSLSSQLTKIYENFISLNTNTVDDISNFKFLEKQVRDIEATQLSMDKCKILKQINNSIIAENDINSQKLQKNSVVVGTPQKIIDLEVSARYQFWLDTTSDDWVKQDTGTIYNAWVLAKGWQKNEFTYEDSIKCVEEKTKRQLRKLQLLAKDKIFVLSSNYSSLGVENNVGISHLIKKQPSDKAVSTRLKIQFEPREDQKPVMEYKQGKLALMAVPGAGKTTVLQALITKLIVEGTAAENIFVLTYMESAAKTLKDRLTNALNLTDDNKNSFSLPNISTIHGLALRIIKENGNYSKVNLGEDFDICDEILRQKIIQESIGELGLKYEEFEKFDKSISIAKYLNISNIPKTKELKEFVEFYKRYQKKLAEKNLIDYDDMLILAVRLLERNPDILSYYQNLCHYILEDEAQDSSAIQQKLINLLAGKHGNIVRCGDINQAITATFTNSDMDGFKQFAQQAVSVEMNYSQRCAKEIFELANKLIDITASEPELSNAFYNIKMQEVIGKNPKSFNSVSAKVYADENEEKESIITGIKNIFQHSPCASVAILVRNNFQVAQYSSFLREKGVLVISRSDCLDQSVIFHKILAILKFCLEPWDNNCVLEVYKTLFNEKEDNLYFENLSVPFIAVDASQLEDINLINLHWELNYWLGLSVLPLEQFVLKIGEYYCEDAVDKSNLYIISEVVRRFMTHSASKQEILSKLLQISKRPTIAGLKLFTADESILSNILGGTVQVMTMHKAKGDEFDYVFVPEFTETTLGSDVKSIKIGDYSSFYEELKALDKSYKTKNAIALKKEILAENLRLLYVTITRAKQKIIFSSPLKQKKFGRMRDVEPSKLFEKLLNQNV
ncbi:ATP-dependent helicase [bacterium]|nr:ATP-dependent helicase [bacterium]